MPGRLCTRVTDERDVHNGPDRHDERQHDVAFLRALIGTMNPYRPRIPSNDNDMALFGDLESLPLNHIRNPTLVVHGTHDADVKFCHGVRAHEQIPGAERVWIEDGSHLGFWLGPHSAQAQDIARESLDRTTRDEAG